MFGWRARIGYLCPSVFEMIAYDFYRIVPSGVGLVGVTCMIDGWQDDAYRKGLERIEECARELGRRNCDFIIHAGVPLVVSQGLGYEREVINKVETLAKVPATTSIVAGMEALRALSVRRVGLVNPYPSDLNKAVVAFLKGHGFEVEAVVSLGADFTRIGDISESDVYAAAKQAVKQSPKVGLVSAMPAISCVGCYRGHRDRPADSRDRSPNIGDLAGVESLKYPKPDSRFR